jgi:hypothetical protein
MKVLYILILISVFKNSYAQNTRKDTLSFKTSEQITEIENYLKTNQVRVRVINTCSTNGELCGTMAFGSSSLIKY